jgi:hypothetical protein
LHSSSMFVMDQTWVPHELSPQAQKAIERP